MAHGTWPREVGPALIQVRPLHLPPQATSDIGVLDVNPRWEAIISSKIRLMPQRKTLRRLC